MTEKCRQFIKEAQNDEAIKVELDALNHKFNGKADDREEIVAQIIAIAKKHGHELDASDFAPDSSEIPDDEISAVAGGGTTCVCVAAGGGGGEDDDGETVGCACVLYGQGGDAHDDNWVCQCEFAGAGE